jgi:hypothetical protein
MPPQQAQPPGMAGGGIVAFQTGGATAGDVFDWDSWNTQYREAQRVGDTTRMEQLKAIAKKVFPTFSDPKKLKEGLKSLIPESGGTLSKIAGRVGTPLAAGEALYQVGMTDPRMLAEEYGFNPEFPGAQTAAGGLGYLEDLASNLTFGAYGAGRRAVSEKGQTSLERARGRTEQTIGDINRGGVKTNFTPDETAIAQNYMAIVRQYGADSPEAKDFETIYGSVCTRRSRGWRCAAFARRGR